ncbi:PHD finger protein 6-like [Mantella aurantiaca]
MAKKDVCSFCGQKAGGELGGLRNTPDKSILAHHDCLIFSPQVFTKDINGESEFDIHSALEEIRRGRTLKCSYCKETGATIGCDIKKCQKTYHYECVINDGGIRDESQYIVFCSRHANESNAADDSERPGKPDRPSTSHEKKIPVKHIVTLYNIKIKSFAFSYNLTFRNKNMLLMESEYCSFCCSAMEEASEGEPGGSYGFIDCHPGVQN